ncbi:MAG TPA: GH92 family glycosyl hydrolase, partial [Puia sp.]|nr:GH92 family glycosyl hydrolase [Puia sp.]
MSKKVLAIIAFLLAYTAVFSQTNVDYIDPTIGNVGQLLQPTRPTVQLPNQMMRMYPMRNDYMDDQIASFPLIIVSHRLGQAFSIKPVMGEVSAESWKAKMTYDHDLEVNRPWYYSTYLIDQGVRVAYTAGKKTGIYRLEFPGEKGRRGLLMDVYNDGGCGWRFTADGEVMAFETYHGDIKVYLYGVFNVKTTAMVEGRRASVFFPEEARQVEFRYAISYISPEQARKNLEEELTGVSFDVLQQKGRQIWEASMGRIQTEGGTEAQRRSFYTALYRCSERMVDITEDGQYYSGWDHRVHRTDRPFYIDDWTWDTYLALHPLRTILDPAQEEDMLNSYVQMYRQGGWMPTFPVLFGDHACMNGFHSSIVFLDAYRKGLRRYDAVTAYEGMKKNALEATMLPWRNGPKCALDDFYQVKGYYPALRPDEKETVALVNPFERRQAVAVTLASSYDDWAVGEMAKELGRQDDYRLFNAHGTDYKHLWNDKAGMFLPRDEAGNWIDIDPKFDGGKGGRDYYDENNGWTYCWQVQEDVKGLMGLMGGAGVFERKLDQLFREPLGRSRADFWYKFPDATGLVGQYSMGNEPSFHIPYLYNYTSPWKTQKRVRFLLDVWFKDNIFGIPGDEDGGGMSAFVVFSSMGFYPVTPGLPVYAIGSPVFEKTTIQLSNGKKFTVLAPGASKVNKYIQSATLNGQVLDSPWITHAQIVEGGVLELKMGAYPNKLWGVGKTLAGPVEKMEPTRARRKYSPSSAYLSYKGLVMAGYQGWFNAPDDGAGRGWNHYNNHGRFEPGVCKIDLWPEVSEYKKTYKTPFVDKDGKPCYVFSSYDASTTDLHFKWMKEYGIDGVFMQRFVSNVKSPVSLHHNDVVLEHALAAAEKYRRAIAVMYDLSGMRQGDDSVVINDWRHLVDELKVACRGKKQTYLYHHGKPLVV